MKLRKNCNDHLILSNLSLRVYVSSVRTRGVVLKKSVLKNCKIRRKTFVPESLSEKSCRLHTCNFIKKETLAQVFSCELYEILKNTFFDRTPLQTASKVSVLLCIFTCLYIVYRWCSSSGIEKGLSQSLKQVTQKFKSFQCL